jgi:hypothetical protein
MILGDGIKQAQTGRICLPEAFNIDRKTGIDPWIVGLVNAAPNYAAALTGCWMSDPLDFHLGRRTTIFISGIFCLVSVIGSGLSQTWP